MKISLTKEYNKLEDKAMIIFRIQKHLILKNDTISLLHSIYTLEQQVQDNLSFANLLMISLKIIL